MGSVTGNSCFLHSTFCNSSLFPKSSSSQCCFHTPPFSFSTLRNGAPNQRRNIKVPPFPEQENPRNSDSRARRAILLMGFAVIPLLNSRANAIESHTAEDTQLRAQEQKEKSHGSSSQNLFFSLLNAFGFLGSAVLAALSASTKKEKSSSDATIESMNIKLKDKEAAIASMKKRIEVELSNEKEVGEKAHAKAKGEKHSLVNQLKLANDTIINLEHELQNENLGVKGLTFKVDNLEISLHESLVEKTELLEKLKENQDSITVLQETNNSLSAEINHKKDTLHQLDLKLAGKERELSELSAVYQQSEDQVISLKTEIKQLKDLFSKNKKELELRNRMVRKLNKELASSQAKRDESSKDLDDILNEYSHFKSSSEQKSISDDAKILGERQENQLEDRLKFSVDEVKNNKVLISDLTQENDNLKEILKIELTNVKNLADELVIAHNTLEKLRGKVSHLSKQLQQSRDLCSELESEISKVQVEFRESKESLLRNTKEAKQSVEVLAGELMSTKELLSKSNKERQILSQEFASAVRKCDSLEKELVDLKEEKKIISSLNKELMVLEALFSKEKEARKNLESVLEESTKSLDEMSRNGLILCRDLEIANARISSMEDEREALYKFIDEQTEISKEARENLEDASNLVIRLGNERESLEKRGKKLEEEVASAKGEILRLRSQINVEQKREKAVVPKRKVARSRKVTTPNPKQEDSQFGLALIHSHSFSSIHKTVKFE